MFNARVLRLDIFMPYKLFIEHLKSLLRQSYQPRPLYILRQIGHADRSKRPDVTRSHHPIAVLTQPVLEVLKHRLHMDWIEWFVVNTANEEGTVIVEPVLGESSAVHCECGGAEERGCRRVTEPGMDGVIGGRYIACSISIYSTTA